MTLVFVLLVAVGLLNARNAVASAVRAPEFGGGFWWWTAIVFEAAIATTCFLAAACVLAAT